MNNMYFDDYSIISDDINNYNEMLISKKTNDMLGSYEGYIKGNMYKNLYKPYMEYKPAKLIPKNEQDELLLNINQLEFAAHDIRLYLDNYPNDREMIKKFNEYQTKANQAVTSYEQKYGPICMNTASSDNTFNWEEYIWPWEMGEK